MRVPPTALISADYDEGEIAINISNFTGSAQAHLYDSNGNVVGNDSAEFMYDGTLTIEVGDLPNGNYTLNVVLGDITFYGEFQVPSWSGITICTDVHYVRSKVKLRRHHQIQGCSWYLTQETFVLRHIGKH